MKKATLLSFLFLLCYSTFSQSIDGGYGQGLVNLVPDTGFEFKNGFKYINPSPNLGFWRLNIVPQRLSTGLQEVQVALNFSIDQPTVIRGQNANGGETLYKPSDFSAKVKGSMNFIIEGTYTDPTTNKQYTFENKKYVSELGSSTINSGLFTYGPDIVNAMARLKITQEADPLAAFLNTFKVKVTSIKAISRNYQGFASMDNELGKRLEQKKTETEHKTQAEAYLRQGHVQYGIRDYQGAKELYQKAYALNKSPETLQLVEGADKALKAEQERLKNENTETNSNGSTSGSSPTLITTSSSSTQTNKTNTTQNKNTTSTQNTKKANTASNDIYNKAEQAGKTLEQMEYEREAYQRQQKEKLQQATNPGGYYMEKSGLNAYFDAQHERLNKEAAEKEAREEREWLARKRREEREYREEQQRKEEYRKKVEAESKRIATDQKQKRDNHYAAIGGDANFNAKRKLFANNAAFTAGQIYKALKAVKASHGFLDPFDNCSYVSLIENIQNSKLSFAKKAIYIQDVLRIRNDHHQFYQDNSYDGAYSIVGRDLENYSCGNYLDVAFRMNNVAYKKDYKYYSGYSFGALNNCCGHYWLKEDKESQYNGIKTDIGAEIKDLGISTWGTNADELYKWMWYVFHSERKKWSDGELNNYRKKKIIYGEEFKNEEQRYIDFLLLRRKHLLSTPENDFKLAYFSYRAGKMEDAIHYFRTYVFRKFGSFENMLVYFKNTNDFDIDPYFSSGSFIDNKHTVQILAASMIYYQAEEYNKAKQLMQVIFSNPSFNKTFNKIYTINQKGIIATLRTLLYDCYFELGEWESIDLPKTDKEFRDAYFDHYNISVMKAFAALKTGNEKWAKKIFSHAYSFYSKKGKTTKDYPTFQGSKSQVVAYKYVMEKLHPKFYPQIKTKELNYGLTTRGETGGAYGGLFIDFYNPYTDLKLTVSDIKNNTQWQAHKNNLLKGADKATVENAFIFCDDYFNKHKFQMNEDDLHFLQLYASAGIALGKFYEVMPAMQVFADLSGWKIEKTLEFQLAKFMTEFVHYGNNGGIGWIDKSDYALVTTMKSLREICVQDSKDMNALKKYLNLWQQYGYTAPQTIYLYLIAMEAVENNSSESNVKAYKAENSELTSDSNKQNIVQTTSGDFVQTNSIKSEMEKRIQKDPNDALAYYNLGVISAQEGNNVKAREYYQKSLELNPDYINSNLNMAALIISDEGTIVDEMNSLGTSDADNKRYDYLNNKRKEIHKSAIPYLKKVLQVNPNEINAARTLMNIYKNIGDTKNHQKYLGIVKSLQN